MRPRHLAIGLRAVGADLGQFGVRLHGQPPTLVFGQMPMQHIHLLQGQHLNDLLDKFRFHEMPAAVQKQSSMTQVRLVLDVHGRKCEPRGTSLLTRLGQQLPQRRPRAKRRFRIPGRHRHLIAFHGQRVALLPQVILRGAPDPIRLAFLGRPLPRELCLLQPRSHGRHVPPSGHIKVRAPSHRNPRPLASPSRGSTTCGKGTRPVNFPAGKGWVSGISHPAINPKNKNPNKNFTPKFITKLYKSLTESTKSQTKS